MTAKELREKRANLINQAGELLKRAEGESRNLTAEENTQWERLHADADQLKTQYERMERQADLESELRQSSGRVAQPQPAESKSFSADEYRNAFGEWMRYGMNGVESEQREMLMQNRGQLDKRAAMTVPDSAGGYLVADELVKKIESAMLPYAGIRNTRATIIRTSAGNDLIMPTCNDTSNSGAILAEADGATDLDLVFGSKTLHAYTYTSRIVRASTEFLRDTAIAGVEDWIAGKLGERIGRATGAHFITGDANSKPEGLAHASTLGVTAADDVDITYSELVDLEHSVNPAYRMVGEWLLADGALKGIKKLKDGEGRPLWVPGVAVREPDTILGHRFAVDANIPTPATGVISVYFGDFSKFHIRDVSGMTLLRLTERYAEYLQVGFLMFSRHDSILLDAGTNPIKHILMA
jgi:HK97 family phage major capsid protein